MWGRAGRWRVVAMALLALSGSIPAFAADHSLEYAVKATFIYKFASFVEWPAGSFVSETAPFELCVVGIDPYGGRIEEAVAGQSVGRHPIVLRHLTLAEPRSSCHEMFLSGSPSQSISEALKEVSGTHVLTVTDSAIGPAAGIVHFVIAEERVSFEIDNAAALKNGLVISSKLLALAHRVTAGRGSVR